MSNLPDNFLTDKKEAIDVIDMIRTFRNDLIKSFLIEESLKKYLADTHRLKEISKVKLEFITRALNELLIAPIDLEHYSRLIIEMRKNSIQVVPEKFSALFFDDIERAIKNYVY